MLPSGDGLSVRPVTQVEAPSSVAPIGDTRGDLYQRALQRILGQQLQGEVMSRFTDGSFMVKVGETAARMMLPNGSKVGDNVPMKLISLEPRPTFEIGNEAGKAAVVALSRGASDEVEVRPPNVALQEQEARADEQEETTRPKTNTTDQAAQQASSTLMGPNNRLAQKFAQIGAMYRPEYEIHSDAPDDGGTLAKIDKDGALILPNANFAKPGFHGQSSATFSNAGRLINQLMQAVQRDGTANALQGQQAIVQEAAPAPQQVATALQNTLNSSGLFYESHVAEWADGKRSLSDLMQEPQMKSHDGAPKLEQNRVEFAQLINLQLTTLEQQSTRWRGEIWPGQAMEWEVKREQDQSGQTAQQGGGQTENWQSVVRFQLPELGTVEASIHLIGQRVHIQVHTDSDDTASLLRAHTDSLADALGAAGSPLDSLLVKHDE